MSGAGGIVWSPDADFARQTNWYKFLAHAGVPDLETLNIRASAEPEWFWRRLIEFQQFPFLKPFEKVLDLSDGVAFPRWCVGGTTNVTLACLDRHIAAGRGGDPAVVFEAEDGTVERLSYAELHERTCRFASGLEKLGLKAGDRVGIFMPMMADSVVGYLALARLGCIILPLFSGFGPAPLVDRLADGGAVALLCVDASLRRGHRIDMKAVLDEAAENIPTLKTVVMKNRFGSAALKPGRDHDWDAVLASGVPNRPAVELPADAPLMIVYTSGTTGKPKGTVHTHCGFGIKTGQDLHLIFDVQAGDRLLWMTDMGWLVGPVQTIGVLMAGATLVLAEGVPDYPAPGRLWDLIARHRVSVLGLSPTAGRLMIQAGLAEVEARDMTCLRLIASTGEPWDIPSWLWIFRNVLKERGPLLNYSGGTEMGGILASHLLKPQRPATLDGPMPGTGADVVDDEGNSVGPGVIGELVMRDACIGTTQGLWQDREKYLDTYWSRIPGMWVHGDYASRDAEGVWRLHGRSDDTIKLAGKRTGPAEIESALMASGLCADAAAVAIPDAIAGAALVCAVVPVKGVVADAAFNQRISAAVTHALGSAYRPKHVVVLDALPKTRNLKTMRRVIRALLVGDAPGDLSSLLNPETLDPIRAAGARLT